MNTKRVEELPLIITRQEAADILRCSVRTVSRLVKRYPGMRAGISGRLVKDKVLKYGKREDTE